MQSIYFGYMTESERVELIEESTLNNEFEKLNMLYEMRTMQYEQNCRDAELKVLSESGTYDDLEYLLEVAATEVAEQKQGILTKIGNVLKNLWKSIKNAFAKLFEKKADSNGELEMSEKELAALNKLTAMTNEMNALTSDVKNGNYNAIIERIKKILPVVTVLGAAGGTVAAGVKLVKTSRSEINEKIMPLKDIVDNVADAIDSLISKIGQIGMVASVQAGDRVWNREVDKEQHEENKSTGKNDTTATEAAEDGKENSNVVMDIIKAALNKLQELGKALRGVLSKITSWLTGKAGEDETKDEDNKKSDDNVEATPVTLNTKDSYSYTGDKKFRIYKDGQIQELKNGNYFPVMDIKTLPAGILKASNLIKNKKGATQEGVEETIDMSEIRELIGKGYMVECTEDYIEITESVEISRKNSIFGSLVEGDIATESAVTDEEHESELARLSNLINSL